jgi:hypothetical protein
MIEHTDHDRPRLPKPGRVVVHAVKHFRPIQKTCRDLPHALAIASRWNHVPDQSLDEIEVYGEARSFAAVTAITDLAGADLIPRGELWRHISA